MVAVLLCIRYQAASDAHTTLGRANGACGRHDAVAVSMQHWADCSTSTIDRYFLERFASLGCGSQQGDQVFLVLVLLIPLVY